MGFLQMYKDQRQIRSINQQNQILREQNRILSAQNVQFSKQILSLTEDDPKFKSNTYKDYKSAVQEISNKYNALSSWGVFQTGSIIDLRAAFIISEGIKVTAKVKGQAKAEIDFCTRFLEYNDLDKEVAQEFAKEAEIEGKILLRLFWEETPGIPSVRFISWTTKGYEIKTDPKDYLDYLKAEWKEDDKQIVIEAPDFVYKKFGGRVNEPNTAAPKIMKCLNLIEDLDKALRDLREINRLFTSPLLWVKFATSQDARKAQEDLDKANWKIRKGLCTNGEVNFAQPNISGIASLEKEIMIRAKMISGSTGIPVHYLGLPELLANRSTSDNLYDLVYASTLKERKIWEGAYQEIIAKAMTMTNAKTGSDQLSTKLDPEKITVSIPFYSRQTWEQIEKVLLPLSLAGKISDELILSKIPNIDAEEEIERKTKEKESAGGNPPFKKIGAKDRFDLSEEDEDGAGVGN